MATLLRADFDPQDAIDAGLVASLILASYFGIATCPRVPEPTRPAERLRIDIYTAPSPTPANVPVRMVPSLMTKMPGKRSTQAEFAPGTY